MTGIVIRTQKIVVTPGTRQVAVVDSGPQGPAGPPGPAEASQVLTTDGDLLTRVATELAPISRVDLAQDPAFKTVVNHGAVASTARSSSHPIFWIGSVNPTNAAEYDQLYRTDTKTHYMRIGGVWEDPLVAKYAPINTGVRVVTGALPAALIGSLVYETTANRFWAHDGTAWRIVGGRMPRCHVWTLVQQSIPHNAMTPVNWEGEDLDTDGLHSTSSLTSRITIPTGLSGFWRFSYSIYWYTAVAGLVYNALSPNGVSGIRYARSQMKIASSSDDAALTGSMDMGLLQGDYVEVMAYQTNGSSIARNINDTSVYNRFQAVYLGPS